MEKERGPASLTGFTGLGRLGLFSFFLGVEEAKELKNTRYLKGMTHTLVDTDQAEKAAIFVMRNVGTH